MREIKEIRDDQIRIIGKEENKIPRYRYMLIVGLIILGVVIIAGIIYANSNRAYEISTIEEAEPVLFEKICVTDTARNKITWSNVDSTVAGYTEIRDTVINDIPLKLYIPHNAQMSLHVGAIDKNDTTIIYAAQAADVRADLCFIHINLALPVNSRKVKKNVLAFHIFRNCECLFIVDSDIDLLFQQIREKLQLHTNNIESQIKSSSEKGGNNREYIIDQKVESCEKLFFPAAFSLSTGAHTHYIVFTNSMQALFV